MKRYALTMRRYERQTTEVRIESTNEKSLKIQYFVDCSDYYKQLMVCTSAGNINGYKQPGDEITRTPINCIHSLAIALQRFICLTINYLDPQLNEWIASMYVCMCVRARDKMETMINYYHNFSSSFYSQHIFIRKKSESVLYSPH